jgi:hypothetical protein
VQHTDFDLFSTFAEAKSNTNPWAFCNFNDFENGGVGAFRDCGRTAADKNQWNSWGGRGGKSDIRFCVDTKGDHPAPPAPTGVDLLSGM